MPSIQIFDPEMFRSILERSGDDADPPLFGSCSQDDRFTFLRRLASDDRKGQRDLLVADDAMIARLKAVAVDAPNFGDPAGVAIRAAQLSKVTGTPFRVPPLLLLGPPGVGKSYFARRLAEAIGAPLVTYPMNCSDDPGDLVGHGPSWRGTRAGLIAQTLVQQSCASPVIFVDEIDKALWKDHGDPTDIFHTLLEPENSRRFIDRFVAEAPMRADFVLWIATANSILKPSLLDRFLVVFIEPPSDAARLDILRNQFAQALAMTGARLAADLNDSVLDELRDATPRQVRLILDLAIASAVSRHQTGLELEDVRLASRIVTGGSVRQKIGF